MVNMDTNALARAASLIAKGNVNSSISAVRLDWNSALLRVSVLYFVDGDVSDDERELCELTLAELLAEFPEIRTAETQCLPTIDEAAYAPTISIYRRGTQGES